MPRLDETALLAGRTVLAVFAHPDDESLACGGTLARLADGGARVVLVCATQGRAGSVADPGLVPDGDLGRVRAAELHAAARLLGAADVVLFDYADGELRWMDVDRQASDFAAVFRDQRPDAVITFAEDGLYWHSDHIAVHERIEAVVNALGEGAPSLYFVTMTEGLMEQMVESAAAEGWAPAESSLWGLPPGAFGADTEPPDFVIDVRDWAPRKLAALQCHRTQLGTLNPLARLDGERARRWLGFEQFRRARPHRGPAILEFLADPVASAGRLRRG